MTENNLQVIVLENKQRLRELSKSGTDAGIKSRTLFETIDQKTIDKYNYEIQKYNEYLDKNGIKSATKENIIQYVEYMRNITRAKENTINCIKFALKKSLIQECETIEQEVQIDTLFKKIKIGKTERIITLDKVLTKKEIAELVNKTDNITSLIIQFLYESACRVSELMQAEHRNAKINGTVKISIRGKGNRERAIDISIALYEKIKMQFGKTGHLFKLKSGQPLYQPYIFRRIRKAGLKYLGKEINIHQLRHTRATHMAEDYNNKTVQNYLGHASVNTTTEYYYHDTADRRDIVKAAAAVFNDEQAEPVPGALYKRMEAEDKQPESKPARPQQQDRKKKVEKYNLAEDFKKTMDEMSAKEKKILTEKLNELKKDMQKK